MKTAAEIRREKEETFVRKGQTKRQRNGDKALGLKLHSLRVRAGLTVRDVAKATGSSDGYVTQIETAYSMPTIGKLAALAAFYEVTLDELCGHMIEAAKNEGKS